jgi:very-short-patch-repair endonuclease
MPPEDAIGAIMRSRQAVIVGDTEQLPPTSFFKKILDDEDEEEDDGETISHESILELAKAVFRPSRRLRWHYRSRHSALIKFSNQNIYQNNLVVFPSPTENREDMGLQHRFIKGQYRAGTNPIEAKEVVKAALRFMRQEPTRSLGIVTLNQKQRELIETELDQALVSMPTAHRYIENWLTKNHGLEPFFIKNLENVQGDERDVIFISTVYGPESIDGPVMQRFGPVSGTTGKRRLNVLFTRAKEQIVTFTSLKASDIKATKESNEGAHLLKCWLEYSSTGNIDPGKITNREPDSEFEIYVMDQIRAMGCEPVPQVGVAGYFIDIAVKHPHWPHGYLMAVECDGATYHSAKSARDRDRLRQEVLENLGWHVYRIWSTDWFNDPILSRQNLGAAIERRLEALKTANVETSPPLVNTTVKEQENENQYLNSSPCDSKMSQYQENSAHSDNIPTSRESGSGHAAKLNLIDVGDRVRIQYLTGNKSTLEFTLTERRNEPDQGFVGSQTPLGQALIGSSVEDEVEVLVGSIIKRAVIEHVIKGYLYESKESAG